MTFRRLFDRFAGIGMAGLTAAVSLLVLALIAGLFIKSIPILNLEPFFDLLFGEGWNPGRGEYGFLPFITGSLWVTGIAFVIAMPLSILTAIYLSEYADPRARACTAPVLDLLSGIPSVVFGLCGVVVLVPLIREHIAPIFGVETTGYTVLTAGIVLAVMIVPLITHVALSVLRAISKDYRDAALTVGATRWQMVYKVLLRKAMPGLVAAVVLGVSRAFGETMAVIMVAGTVAATPTGLFSPGYPIPALVANSYGEMMSIPMAESALMFGALILLAVVLVFNICARTILLRLQQRAR